ncbi:cytochrome P450 [Xylaria arbuscula]|nr:cytochrome P450 [Xylaria arbuscula]
MAHLMSSLFGTVLIRPIYTVVATIGLIAFSFQILLHPLRKYPGPLLAKFTNGYGAFYALKRSLHLQTLEDHRRYGPVVRHGPNKLVFNTATALKQIYQNARVTKPVSYLANQATPGSHNTWNSLDRDMHRQKRKLMAPSCMDIKHRFFADHMPVSNRRLNAYMQIPFIPQHRVQVLINMIWYKPKERAYRLIEHMVKSRMQQQQDARHDFYSFVADGLKTAEERSLRVNDLWMEAILFIVAAMAATFFYLAHHPDCYAKVSDEIQSSFQSGSEMSGNKLASCRYLRACIDESLRMSPPIPGTLWRQQAAYDTDSSPFIVDGHVIPPGTYDYFPEPFKYNPERWLEPDRMKGSLPEPLVAFSTGSRECPSKAMAYMELSLILAKALWYFDFKPAPGKLGQMGFDKNGEFRIHDIYLSTHDGPWLNFIPRKTFSEDFPSL